MYNYTMKTYQWVLLALLFFGTIMLGKAYAINLFSPAKHFANDHVNIVTNELVNQVVTATTFNSTTLVIGQTIGFAYQVNITNCVACSGSVRLEGSIDGINWNLIPGCEAAYAEDGAILFNVPTLYFPYARFQATETTGSATTFNTFFSKKQDIGG